MLPYHRDTKMDTSVAAIESAGLLKENRGGFFLLWDFDLVVQVGATRSTVLLMYLLLRCVKESHLSK